MFQGRGRGRGRGSGRLYGWFRCSECNGHWESSYVFRKGDGYYQQDCKKCNVGYSPYRVEAIRCSFCEETICVCKEEDRRQRHVDPNKPHRSDLCHKCRSGNPCKMA